MESNKHKVLIVQNNYLIALDLQMICSDLGCECMHTKYDPKSIDYAINNNPDIILMDLEEAETKTNIIDKAEEICNQYKIPIIFFTRANSEDYKDHRIKNRCLFHPIPFSAEEISKAIKELLDRYDYPKNN